MSKSTQIELRIKRLSRLLTKRESQLENILNIRLAVGAGLVLSVILSASLPQQRLWPLLFLAFALVLTYLVFYTRNLRRFMAELSQWKQFYLNLQLKREGQFRGAEVNFEYPHRQALIRAQDLNLFGSNSVFSLLDQTTTPEGQKKLWYWLADPQFSLAEILKRQKWIEQLKALRWPLVKMSFLFPKTSQWGDISLLENIKTPVVPKAFLSLLGLHVVLCALAWTLSILWLTQAKSYFWWPLALYLLFSLMNRSRLGDIFGRAQGFSVQLKSLIPVFGFFESRIAPRLPEELAGQVQRLKPSKQLHKVDRIVALLSVQGHPLVHILINLMLPWDYLLAWRLEVWRNQMSQDLPLVFSEFHHFDALASCALFALFQTKTMPIFSDQPQLKFSMLFHPLIDRNKVVANSFSVPDKKSLVLITGSNMSGKSTFLRTIGLNQQLALMGCPVFGGEFTTFLAPVLTCLRVTDSLEEGFSTFYYEVKQISEILHKAQREEPFIYLIDEIFRGTNNRERLIGSRSVIEDLATRTKILGFISTHDLELAQLEENHPQLTNWHFADKITDNQMSFSYLIQPGPCPSTNALYIMANEGLPIEGLHLQ